ncbi:MAG TPA: oligopeptide ABC transporter ATP-binding protein OppF, partial [Candidatus Spyradocola merdavium]|nr:oligopeptide ABC transporter ATP-binding protein OppF [Candidatus Spyradocola merdavium]
RIKLEGEVPSPIAIQGGCKFQTRCTHCTEDCKRQNPVLKEVRPGHFVACLSDQAIGER